MANPQPILYRKRRDRRERREKEHWGWRMAKKAWEYRKYVPGWPGWLAQRRTQLRRQRLPTLRAQQLPQLQPVNPTINQQLLNQIAEYRKQLAQPLKLTQV